MLVATGLLVLLLSVAIACLAPSPAQAGDICVGHPSDASVVCVRNNDTIVDVCDRDPDGHRAYARVITQASYPSFQSPYYDGNDSQPGCANVPFPSRVLSVAVCVQSEGCSAFKQTAPAAAPTVPPPAAAPTVPPPAAAPSAPAPVGDAVIYAAGDISCNEAQRRRAALRPKGPKACQSLATYRKISQLESSRGNPDLPDAVLALGDIQYQRGTFGAFMQNYQLDWGPLKEATYPVLGNHEYLTRKAAGYWGYFAGVAPGSPTQATPFGPTDKGWYFFNVGSWRIYAINSNCADRRGNPGRVSCAPGSEQHRWLRREMRADQSPCSLMFMHHPYWDSSRANFDTPELRPLIAEFSTQGGDVVLAGHAHVYERFARSNPSQEPVSSKSRGFRMFTVGTGGRNLLRFAEKEKLEPNSKRRNNTDFGVLQLRLGKGNYGWRFHSAVDTGGGVFDDRGTGQCQP